MWSRAGIKTNTFYYGVYTNLTIITNGQGSVKSFANGAYGTSSNGASLADVEQAAGDAALMDLIGRLPAGFETEVGERGLKLSGGEKQRVAIARTLVKNPPILLLDEATSALDNVTQAIVMRSILGRPVTRIAIAHRLTTVERADRILVVSGGSIVEEGTPAELLASGGHFARLAARQEF